MKRSAPAGGYDFGPKRNYRRAVWNLFREFAGREIGPAHALLMPSIEGDEIEIALSKGFRQGHLHVVDRNPAIVAHLKRRYPEIHTYGVDVDVAAQRVAAAGAMLVCANLDLCGTYESNAAAIGRFMRSGCMAGRSRLAVTGLRGREQKPDGNVRRTVHSNKPHLLEADGQVVGEGGDVGRSIDLLAAVVGNTGYSARLKTVRQYPSTAGSQTMMWATVDVYHGEWIRDRFIELRSALIEGSEKEAARLWVLLCPCLRCGLHLEDAAPMLLNAPEGAISGATFDGQIFGFSLFTQTRDGTWQRRSGDAAELHLHGRQLWTERTGGDHYRM